MAMNTIIVTGKNIETIIGSMSGRLIHLKQTNITEVQNPQTVIIETKDGEMMVIETIIMIAGKNTNIFQQSVVV